MIESIQRDSKARRVTPSPTNYSDRDIFGLYLLIISVTIILTYNFDTISILLRMIRFLNFDSIYMSYSNFVLLESNRDTWILLKRFSNRDSIDMSFLNFVTLKSNLDSWTFFKKLKSLNFDFIYTLNSLNIVSLESYLNFILLESNLDVDYMYLKLVNPIFDLKWLSNFVSLESNFDFKLIHHDTKSKFSLNLSLKKTIVDFIAEMWKKNKQFLCLISQILNSVSDCILAVFYNILKMFYHEEFMKRPALATFRILYF